MTTPSTSRGLSSAEALTRLEAHGPNAIRAQPGPSAWVVLASQFKGAMIWLLLGACVVSALLGEVGDALAIGCIVVLNGLVGFFQEYRAEQAVQALMSMAAPRARVLRDGHAVIVAASDVVLGDVLLLEAGDLVAADARVMTAHQLLAQEAALTGESHAVTKSAQPVAANTPLAERSDSMFAGTSVAAGTGEAEVMATGMETELGRIAHLLQTVEEEATPLTAELERVGGSLLKMCLVVVAVVAGASLLRGVPWLEVLMSSVSLAVAAVPEGLPAMVTIALAVGVQRMARRQVLVRRLRSVETLGCANVICTDKTGTLTTGTMVVRDVWAMDKSAALRAAASCCDAELGQGERSATGDPTELALLAAAHELGISRDEIERNLPRVRVQPFDSLTRRMSVERSDGISYVKGAVESVLPLCTSADGAHEANQALARRGLRVLAIAAGKGEQLALMGLVGIADPPRPEAVDAVLRARAAGVETVMITGDHPATAEAIARELHIAGANLTLPEAVHARATPAEKLEIVRQWKARGAVVAMTGDGVNDAPALKEAHIGIAMGKGGTDVARQASDMILLDDNFASIVAAVHEGRGIYDNIQRALIYLLAGNVGELLLMLGAALAGLPLPLLPLQLLWINLVTDGLPALALVMEPAGKDLLNQPPRAASARMLGASQWRFTALIGGLEAALALAAFMYTYHVDDLAAARTLTFSVVIYCEIFRALAARSSTLTFPELGPATNPYLLAVVGGSVLLQWLIEESTALQSVFGTGGLTLTETAFSMLIGLVPVTLLELIKLGRRFWVGKSVAASS